MARPNLKDSNGILNLINLATQKLLKKEDLEKIDIEKYRAIIYGCATASSVIKTLDLENRIEKLEESLK